MRSRLVICSLACAVACIAPAAASAKPKPKVRYYLALGDSLSRGAQPNTAGTTVPTNSGYVDDLFAFEKSKLKHLKLKKLGCLGETTTTMMKGGVCKYAKGSQLAQAKKFIKTHKIALITIDIGANDIDGCVKNGVPDLLCFNQGVQTIQTNLPKIVKALRKAARSKVKIVAMTYYDPFLAEYLSSNPGGKLVAEASVSLADQVNKDLTSDYTAGKFKVADVAGAYKTDVPFTTTTPFPPFGNVPVSVVTICANTWMCAAAPRGPNIHANATGYTVIAKAFEAVL